MEFIKIVLFFACFTIFETQSKELDSLFLSQSHMSSANLTVVQKWQNIEKQFKSLVNGGVKFMLPRLMEISGNIALSSDCMGDIFKVIGGIKNLKPWAMRLLDASGKFPNGIFVGTVSSFGVYDECVDTVAANEKGKDKGKVLFRGQYCSVDVNLPLPEKEKYYKMNDVPSVLQNFSRGETIFSDMAKLANFLHFLSLRWGICVPSGCTLNDVNQVAKLVGDAFKVEVKASRCEVKEENTFSSLQIAVMCLYSLTGLLMLLGSTLDIYCFYTKSSFKSAGVKYLQAFSLITNFKKFSDTKTSSDTLSCLNGIRFFCMCGIIIGHTYFLVNYQLLLGLEKVKDYGKDFAFQPVLNGTFSVNTFFCMAGLLVSYVNVKIKGNGGQSFSITFYIIHRIWRVIPVSIFLILFMFLVSLLGSGPIWHETTDPLIQYCYDNWWTNLIFINNFYNIDSICILQSWYISCDVQLYLAALLVVLPMKRWPKVGLYICVAAILASIAYTGIATYVFDYPPTMLFVHPDVEQRTQFMTGFYFRPFMHAASYFIGMLTGYLLAVKPNLKIPKHIQLIGWSLAFIGNFSVLYGVYEWNKGTDPTLWGKLLYASLSRSVWTLGISWMIVCCATGHGGVINYILSWKAFVPLGRLTFLAYLLHPIVQLIYLGNIRTLLQPDHFVAVWLSFGHILATYGIAFACSMLVESPMISIEKNIFGKINDKVEDKKNPMYSKSLSPPNTMGTFA